MFDYKKLFFFSFSKRPHAFSFLKRLGWDSLQKRKGASNLVLKLIAPSLLELEKAIEKKSKRLLSSPTPKQTLIEMKHHSEFWGGVSVASNDLCLFILNMERLIAHVNDSPNVNAEDSPFQVSDEEISETLVSIKQESSNFILSFLDEVSSKVS